MDLRARSFSNPPADTATRLQGVLMSEYARKHAEHNLRTAEAIVDFIFDVVEGSVAKVRSLTASPIRH
jgi:hypothetical protein